MGDASEILKKSLARLILGFILYGVIPAGVAQW